MTLPTAVGLIGPLPPPSGGIANQTRQLERLLREAGLSVTVIQMNAPYRPALVRHLPVIRAVFRFVPYSLRLWRAAAKVDLFHVMASSGWAWHVFAAPAIWMAHLRGRPVIVNYRGGAAETFFKSQFRWVKPALRRASTVVVPSRFLETVFEKWNTKTSIVPNIIDLSRFQPGIRQRQDAHIVVARNLEHLYDIGTAMRAFAVLRKHFPSARLSVAGSGSVRAELENLRTELGLEAAIEFTGRLDNEQMASLYQTADLMLNPSLADNMPISVLEAMASGVPVVSTNVGGIPYLVEDGVTALLVPPRNAEAMAAAALQVLSSPALAAKLRTAGLAEVQQYSWDRVRDRLFEVYAGVLRPNGRALETGGG